MFFGIEGSEGWRRVTPVDKGWSADRKFRVETQAGAQLLLRLSDGEKFEQKRREFEMIRGFSATGVPMSMPLAFGRCEGGRAYMLLTYIEGEDLETVLPRLSEAKQYDLGRAAGDMLKKLHGLPLSAADRPAATKREKKLAQLSRYEACDVRIPGDEPLIRFVRENIGCIWQEAPVYLHGDFHPGNLIYRPDGSLGVIDFNRWEVGDPYEEFYKLQSFAREISVPYCVGQIRAYFSDHVPQAFWRAQAVYVAHAALFSILWAKPFGQRDMDGMVRRCRLAMDDYDGFATLVPKWFPSYKT